MRKSSIGTTRRQLALSAAVAALAPSSVGVVTTAQAQDGGILALLGAWRTAAAAVDRVHFEASAYEESGVQVPARLASQSIRLKAQRDAILGRMLECQPTSVAGIAALAEVAASMFGDSVAELDSELERDRARGSVDAETFSIATVIAVLRAVQVGT